MKRILVIEKDQWMRELISTRLSARHYEVVGAETSLEAIKYLGRMPFALILLSNDMEMVEGCTMIQLIRSRAHLGAVPVILTLREEQLSSLLMSSYTDFDDFLVTPVNSLVLQLRVQLCIERHLKKVEVNALTHLPGNHAIEKYIHNKIQRAKKFSVIYIDINHFKSFNDRYGFHKGDEVIQQTARLLQAVGDVISDHGDFFVGHVGGDDFVVVTTPDLEEVFAKQFIDDFDRIIPAYYSEEDRNNGFAYVKNRKGEMEKFPIMSCSVAACTNLYREYKGLGEIARDAAEVKSFLKMQRGSHYLRDRRCAEEVGLEEMQGVLQDELESHEAKKNKVIDPLGKLLLGAGLISEEQLSTALKMHFETGQRLGQCLIYMNAVSSDRVGQVLSKKLKVPYISLKKWKPNSSVLDLFTQEFITTHRTVPFYADDKTIKIAMCDPFDVKVVDMVERITDLKPEPHLTLENDFEYFLENVLTDDETEGQKIAQ